MLQPKKNQQQKDTVNISNNVREYKMKRPSFSADIKKEVSEDGVDDVQESSFVPKEMDKSIDTGDADSIGFMKAFDILPEEDKYRVGALLTDLGTSFIPAVSIAGDLAVTGLNLTANIKDPNATILGTIGEAALDLGLGVANAVGVPSFAVKLAKPGFRRTVGGLFRVLKQYTALNMAVVAPEVLEIFDKRAQDISVDDMRKVTAFIGTVPGIANIIKGDKIKNYLKPKVAKRKTSYEEAFGEGTHKMRRKSVINKTLAKNGDITDVERKELTAKYNEVMDKFDSKVTNNPLYASLRNKYSRTGAAVELGLPSDIGTSSLVKGKVGKLVGKITPERLVGTTWFGRTKEKGFNRISDIVSKPAVRGMIKQEKDDFNDDGPENRATLRELNKLENLDLDQRWMVNGSNKTITMALRDVKRNLGESKIEGYSKMSASEKRDAIQNYITKKKKAMETKKYKSGGLVPKAQKGLKTAAEVAAEEEAKAEKRLLTTKSLLKFGSNFRFSDFMKPVKVREVPFSIRKKEKAPRSTKQVVSRIGYDTTVANLHRGNTGVDTSNPFEGRVQQMHNYAKSLDILNNAGAQLDSSTNAVAAANIEREHADDVAATAVDNDNIAAENLLNRQTAAALVARYQKEDTAKRHNALRLGNSLFKGVTDQIGVKLGEKTKKDKDAATKYVNDFEMTMGNAFYLENDPLKKKEMMDGFNKSFGYPEGSTYGGMKALIYK